MKTTISSYHRIKFSHLSLSVSLSLDKDNEILGTHRKKCFSFIELENHPQRDTYDLIVYVTTVA